MQAFEWKRVRLERLIMCEDAVAHARPEARGCTTYHFARSLYVHSMHANRVLYSDVGSHGGRGAVSWPWPKPSLV